MLRRMSVFAMIILSVTYAVNAATWTTSDEWILKNGNRLFAIGIWLPTSACDDYNEINTELSDFNVLFAKCDSVNSNMSSKVVLTGYSVLPWRLKAGGYTGELDHLGYSNGDGYISYSEMQSLYNIYWHNDFKDYLYDNVVSFIANLMSSAGINDYIYYMKDEPETNFTSWCFPPEILHSYLGEIQDYSDNELGGANRIGAIGYGGVVGNRYFYQQEVGAYDDDTPYDQYSGGFPEGIASYNGSAPSESNYANNVSTKVYQYGNSTNLHLLNCYSFFRSNPNNAAKVVNAMRDGMPYSSKNIWLWFNALEMNTVSTYANVRCQIYTAMTRKCTGAMLYCLENPTSTNITYAKTIAAELHNFEGVWTSGVASNDHCEGYTTLGQKVNDTMYWAIFDSSGVDYCLIANTHSQPLLIKNSDVSGFDLKATSVLIPGYGVRLYRVNGYHPALKPTDESGMELVNLLADIGNTEEDIVSNDITVVEDANPENFAIYTYPNPFNPTTTLTYMLPQAGEVQITVYSVSGQKVATLVDEYRAAGTHSVVFDGTELTSGVYIYRIGCAGVQKTGRMTLIK